MHLDFIDERIKNYYFQYTLNDYDQEKLEPNVPNVQSRIDTFIECSLGNDTDLCYGDTITISASYFNNLGQVSFQWNTSANDTLQTKFLNVIKKKIKIQYDIHFNCYISLWIDKVYGHIGMFSVQ